MSGAQDKLACYIKLPQPTCGASLSSAHAVNTSASTVLPANLSSLFDSDYEVLQENQSIASSAELYGDHNPGCCEDKLHGDASATPSRTCSVLLTPQCMSFALPEEGYDLPGELRNAFVGLDAVDDFNANFNEVADHGIVVPEKFRKAFVGEKRFQALNNASKIWSGAPDAASSLASTQRPLRRRLRDHLGGALARSSQCFFWRRRTVDEEDEEEEDHACDELDALIAESLAGVQDALRADSLILQAVQDSSEGSWRA